MGGRLSPRDRQSARMAHGCASSCHNRCCRTEALLVGYRGAGVIVQSEAWRAKILCPEEGALADWHARTLRSISQPMRTAGARADRVAFGLLAPSRGSVTYGVNTLFVW